jgi:hypothetical protein
LEVTFRDFGLIQTHENRLSFYNRVPLPTWRPRLCLFYWVGRQRNVNISSLSDFPGVGWRSRADSTGLRGPHPILRLCGTDLCAGPTPAPLANPPGPGCLAQRIRDRVAGRGWRADRWARADIAVTSPSVSSPGSRLQSAGWALIGDSSAGRPGHRCTRPAASGGSAMPTGRARVGRLEGTALPPSVRRPATAGPWRDLEAYAFAQGAHPGPAREPAATGPRRRVCGFVGAASGPRPGVGYGPCRGHHRQRPAGNPCAASQVRWSAIRRVRRGRQDSQWC